MTTFHVVCHLSQVQSGSYTLLGLFWGKKTCRNLRAILEFSQIHNFWTRFVFKKKWVIPNFKAKKISHVFSFFCWGKNKTTFPETNIYPENRPLEEEIPIGNHHFQGLC